MKIAVEGCAHGELEKIYNTIEGIENEQNIKIDLLLCCGDFQSTRNLADLQTMAVPKKFQDMGTFYKYYSGELKAPVLTIFIGGNHEASNYLQELPYGGWVAPNIYYLGFAGVINVNGVRIAGISGIYKGHDFLRGRYEFPPYTDASIRSVYHVRQLDVFRLKQLSGTIDIFISHDWPRGIYNYGNKEQLVRFKPHFRDEIDNNQLGSRPCEDLLYTLKPKMWFAAHLHCQFVALVTHEFDNRKEDNTTNFDADINEVSQRQDIAPTRLTKFLALDKCLPKRRFLQIVDIETSKNSGEDNDVDQRSATSTNLLKLEYDLEWLSILYHTNHLISVKNSNYYMPGPRGGGNDERYDFTPTEDELETVRKKFNEGLRIPDNFCCTVAPYDPKQDSNSTCTSQPKPQINPQTSLFCDILGIDDPLSLAMVIGGHDLSFSSTVNSSATSFNESNVSLTSELNLSAIRFDVSTSSESSPQQRKGNVSLNLPKPQATTENYAASLLESPEKRKISLNPDEVELSNSDGESSNSPGLQEDDGMLSQSKLNANIVTQPLIEETPATLAIDGKSPTKKFKRRNQELYTEKTEDDNQ